MNEQLFAYVTDGLAKGIKKEALEANLLKAGWQKEVVDQAFAQAGGSFPGSSTLSGIPQTAQGVVGAGNGSGLGSASVIPPGVSGWGWGPFLLTWIWGIAHKVWISLLIFIPFIGWIMWIMLGVKGREWAWRAQRWESVDHFNRVQRKWSMWGVILSVIPPFAILLIFMILVLFAGP